MHMGWHTAVVKQHLTQARLYNATIISKKMNANLKVLFTIYWYAK